MSDKPTKTAPQEDIRPCPYCGSFMQCRIGGLGESRFDPGKAGYTHLSCTLSDCFYNFRYAWTENTEAVDAMIATHNELCDRLKVPESLEAAVTGSITAWLQKKATAMGQRSDYFGPPDDEYVKWISAAVAPLLSKPTVDHERVEQGMYDWIVELRLTPRSLTLENVKTKLAELYGGGPEIAWADGPPKEPGWYSYAEWIETSNEWVCCRVILEHGELVMVLNDHQRLVRHIPDTAHWGPKIEMPTTLCPREIKEPTS